VNAVHESCVVAHLWRQWSKEMPDTLLVLHIDIEIAD